MSKVNGETLIKVPDKVKLKLSADIFTTARHEDIPYRYHTDRLTGMFTTIALEYDFFSRAVDVMGAYWAALTSPFTWANLMSSNLFLCQSIEIPK